MQTIVATYVTSLGSDSRFIFYEFETIEPGLSFGRPTFEFQGIRKKK